MPKRAIVVLAPGFEEIEAVTPIDVLRRAGIDVTVAGVGGEQIKGSRGITIHADAVLDPGIQPPNALILPGGMPGAKHLGDSDAVRALTEATYAAGGLVAAICAAPALTLAKWGLLEGKRATCYPSFEESFPESATHSEERVVVDGRIITSRGPGTAMEFALTLVEHLLDPSEADKLRSGMQVT